MKPNKRETFVMLIAYGLSKLLRVDIIMVTRAQLTGIVDESIQKISKRLDDK